MKRRKTNVIDKLKRNWKYQYAGVCETCGGEVLLKWNNAVFELPKPTGAIYVCENFPECKSYTTCHVGTTEPIHTVTELPIREHRMKAHESFDWVWKSGTMKRNEAYLWLSIRLNIPQNICHIGRFDEEMCKKVIQITTELKHTLQG